MPKFKVLLQQYVEEVAEMTVTAPDVQTAIAFAKAHADEADWSDGDDSYGVACWAVYDASGDPVYER
jgi:hypothetical protein